MMLTETLIAEIGFIDAEIRALNRARFNALARCDGGRSKKIYEKIRALKERRRELTKGTEFDF